MKKVFLGCMIITAFLMLLSGGMVAMQEKTIFYQMTYQTENVTGQLLVNGFVITEFDGKTGNGSAALNPWLIGDNEIKADIKKANPSKPSEFSFGVSEMERGATVSTTDKGKLISIELKNKDFGADGKATSAKKFKSILDFKKHLSDAGRANEKDVYAYAQKLYAMFAKKDTESILRESEIKVIDYSKAFGGVDMKSELRRFLTEELFRAKLNKLNPASLRAVAVGPTKRIWHIFNGKEELIQAKSSDGSTFDLAVYVGMINGKLKIVR
ncbi:MAG: hypothetical protein V1874_16660 [Spirochaetota bacterium]